MVKNRPKIAKNGISMLFGALPWHGKMCNLDVIGVLEFICRNLYLLFAILFFSKFQNSFFYQHMRPKSGLKSPGPFLWFHFKFFVNAYLNLYRKHSSCIYRKHSNCISIIKTCSCNIQRIVSALKIKKKKTL